MNAMDTIRLLVGEYLKAHCRGRERARTKDTIKLDLAIDSMVKDADRAVRIAYTDAGACSSKDGVFLPMSPEEAQESHAYLCATYGREIADKRMESVYRAFPQHRPRPKGVPAEQGNLFGEAQP